MYSERSWRGFVFVMHERYPPEGDPGQVARLVSESSAVGDYDDALDRPGSSYLWVGDAHHLNREQVADLVERLTHWLDTGRLKVDCVSGKEGA